MKTHNLEDSLSKCKICYIFVLVLAFWIEVRDWTWGYILQPPVDSSKKPIVWVLGGPGSGKGTQCDKIVATYGFTHLSTGDLLRAEVATGSERAKCLTSIMERGELVPNDVVLDLLKEAIDREAEKSKGFLIDGYPREKSQGVAFEKSIAPVTVILYFECKSETLIERLLSRAKSSGRADDNEQTIKLRLKTFHENNDMVLAQYPNKLVRINAERTVDAIFQDVQKNLDPIVAAAAAAEAVTKVAAEKEAKAAPPKEADSTHA